MEQSTATEEQVRYGGVPASDNPREAVARVSVLTLLGGERIVTATHRESLLGSLSHSIASGDPFIWIDPPNYVAHSSDEQIVIRADRVVSVAYGPAL